MGLRELKAELKQLDNDTLIKHIAELYKKYKPVKEYFDFFINPNEKEIIEQYKDKVREGFYPKRGFALKLSIARNAINEFKKLGTSKDSLADLMFYYVDCGVEFTNEFGDIDESFYLSLENQYQKTLELIHKEALLDKYKDRAFTIVKNTENIGWGFHDYISEVFYQYYQ